MKRAHGDISKALEQPLKKRYPSYLVEYAIMQHSEIKHVAAMHISDRAAAKAQLAAKLATLYSNEVSSLRSIIERPKTTAEHLASLTPSQLRELCR